MQERKRKLEENNDHIEDIPKIPKRTPVEAENFAFNEKRWLVEERINHVNQLPLEILDKIFRKYLTSRDRKNVRLVCQSWYIRGQPYNETLNFYPKRRRKDDVVLDPFSDDIELQHLKNCGFKNLNLHFSGTNVSLIPRPVWQTIGARIYSLNLSYCRLGDSAMVFIVLYCENLRILRLMIEDVEDLFYSVNKLEELNVTRRTLDTLRIHSMSSCYFRSNDFKQFDSEKWRQMYCTIHRIFPNVTHYNCGSNAPYKEVQFCIELSVGEFSMKNDKSGLNVALAYAMSANNDNALLEDGRRALQALSTVRLTCVSLSWRKPTFESEDKDVILNFFTSQKELESIDFELEENCLLETYNCLRFAETLTSIVLHILSTCFQLRKLYYCNRQEWLHLQEKTIHSQLFTKTCKLEKFAISKLLVEGSTIQSWGLALFDRTVYQRTMPILAPFHTHLVHLILQNRIKYSVLEPVFKYMINLKSLEVDLHYSCRTMSKIRENNGNGISMKQLQNLERLKVHLAIKEENGVSVFVDDNLFDGFEFPKLRYLYCPLPEKTSVLNCIGIQMPSLREVNFSLPDSDEDENLESHAVDIFQTTDTTKIFARCSTLRSLRYWRGTYFYEPVTQRVIFDAERDRLIRLTINTW